MQENMRRVLGNQWFVFSSSEQFGQEYFFIELFKIYLGFTFLTFFYIYLIRNEVNKSDLDTEQMSVFNI